MLSQCMLSSAPMLKVTMQADPCLELGRGGRAARFTQGSCCPNPQRLRSTRPTCGALRCSQLRRQRPCLLVGAVGVGGWCMVALVGCRVHNIIEVECRTRGLHYHTKATATTTATTTRKPPPAQPPPPQPPPQPPAAFVQSVAEHLHQREESIHTPSRKQHYPLDGQQHASYRQRKV